MSTGEMSWWSTVKPIRTGISITTFSGAASRWTTAHPPAEAGAAIARSATRARVRRRAMRRSMTTSWWMGMIVPA